MIKPSSLVAPIILVAKEVFYHPTTIYLIYHHKKLVKMDVLDICYLEEAMED
jgi:hypothetical protein